MCCLLLQDKHLKEKLKTMGKKMLNVLVSSKSFYEFKYLCTLNHITMSKVITDFIDKYVADGKKEWADKINAPKPKKN